MTISETSAHQAALRNAKSALLSLAQKTKDVGPSLFGAGSPQGFHFILAHFFVVIAICVCCMLAVGGGVGGGGLYMPILVGTTGDAHVAVPLAKVATNGVAVAGTVFNLWKKHPNGGPMINYDVALLLEPLTLMGTVFGVIMNVLLPSEALLLILVAVLTLSSYVSIKKGFERKKKEDKEIAAKKGDESSKALLSSDENSSAQDTSESVSRDDLQTPPSSNNMTSDERTSGVDTSNTDTSEEKLRNSKRVVKNPWLVYGLPIALVAFGVIVHMMTMYYSKGASGLLCGGGFHLKRILITCDFVILILLVLLWRWKVLSTKAKSKDHGRDSYITPISSIVAPVLSGVAGVMAGGLGIAGGLMKGPIMVAWGLEPQEATATSLFMIMFT